MNHQRHTHLLVSHWSTGSTTSCWFTNAADAWALAKALHQEHPTWRFAIDGKDLAFSSDAKIVRLSAFA